MSRRVPGARDRGAPAHDPGLQAERTAMAWERTALGVGGVSALLLHDTGSRMLLKVPGLVGLVAALALLVLAQVRYEQTVRCLEDGRSPGAAGPVLAMSCTAALLATVCIGVIIVQGGG